MSVGFKNYISSERGAVRITESIKKNPKYTKFEGVLHEYRTKIIGLLYERCLAVVKICEDKCMPLAKDNEAKAFFWKMIGDYYRYAAESAEGANLENAKQSGLKAYEQAS